MPAVDETEIEENIVCPRCSLGRHRDCTETVLLGHNEDGENIWGECACHARGHQPVRSDE